MRREKERKTLQAFGQFVKLGIGRTLKGWQETHREGGDWWLQRQRGAAGAVSLDQNVALSEIGSFAFEI